MTCQHEPLCIGALPVTIGGLLDRVRGHVCMHCKLVYVRDEDVAAAITRHAEVNARALEIKRVTIGSARRPLPRRR